MKGKILEKLSAIEAEENIKILYACESGSRAWGFPSKDSDYDVRFIYVRDMDWYLRVDHEYQRDVVERPVDELLDINGWDLKKALKLLRKSNPALIEWLSSPIVYRCDDVFTRELKELIPKYYSPRACFYHYAHMANGNNRGYLQGDLVKPKKYFYVLRPILAMMWIKKGLGVVPVEFEVLVDSLIDDESLHEDIRLLLKGKRSGFEAEQMPRIESISNFIDRQLERLEGRAQEFDGTEESYESINRFFLSVLKR